MGKLLLLMFRNTPAGGIPEEEAQADDRDMDLRVSAPLINRGFGRKVLALRARGG
jgi:hypothetical protein